MFLRTYVGVYVGVLLTDLNEKYTTMNYKITQSYIAKDGGVLAVFRITGTAFLYLLVPKYNNAGGSYNKALFSPHCYSQVRVFVASR